MRRYACCVCVVALIATGVAWAVEDASFQAETLSHVTVLHGNPWSHHIGIVEGTGQGSHLGTFTITIEAVVKGNGDSQSTGVIETSNGDELYLEMTSYVDWDRGIRVGHFTFTAGTGKFESASGGGTMEATYVGDGYYETTMAGTISY